MDFHALFDAQYVPVYRYLAHRLGDRAAAEDLAAETFLRAYAARASFRPGSPRAWLFTIATNLLRDHVRGAGRRDAAFAEWASREAGAGEPEFQLPDPQLALALAALRAEEREALLLYAWAELSYEEIATVTGVAVGTVRSRLARARTRSPPSSPPRGARSDRRRSPPRKPHSAIPEPDAATVARARALLLEAMARDAAGAPARGLATETEAPPSAPRRAGAGSRTASARLGALRLVPSPRRARPGRTSRRSQVLPRGGPSAPPRTPAPCSTSAPRTT